MTFLIAQMLICLLLAALVGFVAGWLLSRLYCRIARQRTEAAQVMRQRQDRAALEKGIDEARQRAARLDREMAALRMERDTLKSQLDPSQRRVADLEATLVPAQQRVGQLEAELSSTVQAWKERLGLETRTRESLETELASLQSGLEEHRLMGDEGTRHLEQELASATAMCRAQQDELSGLRERLEAAELEARSAGEKLGLLASEVGPDRERLEGELLEQRVRIAQLEADRDEYRRRAADALLSPASPSSTSPASPASLTSPKAAGSEVPTAFGAFSPSKPAAPPSGKIAKQSADEETGSLRRVVDLEATIERPRSSLGLAKSPDDLKKIRGIGKVLEGMLNRLGVLHFHQIARWDDVAIESISDQLGAFKGRIERDQWVEQAQRLDRETQGGE